MIIGVTFEEDDTKLGREICFCYFLSSGFYQWNRISHLDYQFHKPAWL